jgi:hypothetical protein
MKESEQLTSLLSELDDSEELSIDEFVSDFASYEKKMGLSHSKKDVVISMQEYRNLVCTNSLSRKK